jgi:general stress protein 26
LEQLSPSELQRVIDDTYTATFCTTNPNGTIHAVPIWYRHDGESYWVVTGAEQRKTRNLALDPRVSLSLLITKSGPTRTVIALVYGTAVIHHLPHDELKDKAAWIFTKYVDEAGVRQRVDAVPPTGGVAIQVKPDKTLAWHP